MYILPNATDFNNACASESRTVATKCEIYDDITETSVGEIATFDTGVSKPLSSLKVGLSAVQDLHGYSKPWVGGAGKNKLPMTKATNTTQQVTYTNYNGNYLGIKGTASANAYYWFNNEGLILQDNTDYVLTTDGLQSGMIIQVCERATQGASLTYLVSAGNADVNSSFHTGTSPYMRDVRIYVTSGTAITTEQIVKVMVRLASETDATWQPYSNICPIYPSNGKNLLPPRASAEENGITFTVNADGTVTATGTATADAQFRYTVTGLDGNYYFCGCPSGGSSSKYDVYAWDDNTNARPKKWNGTSTTPSDYGTFAFQEMQVPSGHTIKIILRVKSGYAIQGSLLFKPMIVSSTETSNIYVPYQGINAYQGGKNLCDTSYAVLMGTNTSITVDGGSIRVQNSDSYRYTAFGFFRNGLQESGFLPLTQLTWSFDVSGELTTTWQAGLRYCSNNNFLTNARVEFSTAGHYTVTFDLSQITEPVYLSASRTGNSTANIDVTFSNMQLELGQTATAYEPYTSTTYPIPLGQTVYGGTLDVVSGVLTVDKAIVDLGSLTWTRRGTYAMQTNSLSSLIAQPTSSEVPDMYCSIAKTSSWTVFVNSGATSNLMGTSAGYFAIATTETDANTFKTNVTGQTLVYPLATPVEYNLTPTQIKTLLGTNNIWSDGNNISEITYYGVNVTMDGDGINGEIISMEWDNIVCSNDGLQIGTTCMDEFKMTYRPVSTTMSLMGKEIHPYVGLEFGYPATVTYVPLGVFYVTNSETNDDGYTVNITAYDGMQKLLGNFDATALGVTFPINAWALLTAIATHFDLTVSYDKLTYELLTSDNYTLTTSNGDTLLVQQEINANQQAPLNKPLEGTYRDYVGWIVGLVGANAHMGRSGDLWVGRYEDHGFVIGRNVQHMGGAKINYGGSVTYECIISGTDEEPLQPTGHSGNSITYTNPYITQEELDILNDALFADGNVVVTPCDVAWRSNPCVDAGDIVSVEDKDGNNSLTYVMERVIRVTGGLAEDLHCYAETEVVHTLNKSPLVTKFAQLTNDIKEAVNPIDATKGTFEFIDNGDGTNGGFTIYENGTNSWLRCTAGGLGISADGGLTYANAITKNGVTATNLEVTDSGKTILRAGVVYNTPLIEFKNLLGNQALRIDYSDYFKRSTLSMRDPVNGFSTNALALLVGRTGTMPGDGNGGFSEVTLQDPRTNGKGRISLSLTYSDDTTKYATSDLLMASGDPSKSFFRIRLRVGDDTTYGDSSTIGIFDGSTGNEMIGIRDDRGTPLMFVKSGNSYKSLTLRAISINGTTYYIMAST